MPRAVSLTVPHPVVHIPVKNHIARQQTRQRQHERRYTMRLVPFRSRYPARRQNYITQRVHHYPPMILTANTRTVSQLNLTTTTHVILVHSKTVTTYKTRVQLRHKILVQHTAQIRNISQTRAVRRSYHTTQLMNTETIPPPLHPKNTLRTVTVIPIPTHLLRPIVVTQQHLTPVVKLILMIDHILQLPTNPRRLTRLNNQLRSHIHLRTQPDRVNQTP